MDFVMKVLSTWRVWEISMHTMTREKMKTKRRKGNLEDAYASGKDCG
jgi:hypothetical protein